MKISVACQCGKSYQVDSEHAGRLAKCPACGVSLQLPTPVTREGNRASSITSPAATSDEIPAASEKNGKLPVIALAAIGAVAFLLLGVATALWLLSGEERQKESNTPDNRTVAAYEEEIASDQYPRSATAAKPLDPTPTSTPVAQPDQIIDSALDEQNDARPVETAPQTAPLMSSQEKPDNDPTHSPSEVPAANASEPVARNPGNVAVADPARRQEIRNRPSDTSTATTNPESAWSIARLDPQAKKFFLMKASCDGDYSNLLMTIFVEEDQSEYGNFHDFGYYDQSTYKSHSSLPPGYWVYVYPHWAIWGNKSGSASPNVASSAKRHPDFSRLSGKWGRVYQDAPPVIEFLPAGKARFFMNSTPAAGTYFKRDNAIMVKGRSLPGGQMYGRFGTPPQTSTAPQSPSTNAGRGRTIWFRSQSGRFITYQTAGDLQEEYQLGGKWIRRNFAGPARNLPDVFSLQQDGSVKVEYLIRGQTETHRYELNGGNRLQFLASAARPLVVNYKFEGNDLLLIETGAIAKQTIRYKKVMESYLKPAADDEPAFIAESQIKKRGKPLHEALSSQLVQLIYQGINPDDPDTYLVEIRRTRPEERGKGLKNQDADQQLELKTYLSPGFLTDVQGKVSSDKRLSIGQVGPPKVFSVRNSDTEIVIASLTSLQTGSGETTPNEFVLRKDEPVLCRMVAYYSSIGDLKQKLKFIPKGNLLGHDKRAQMKLAQAILEQRPIEKYDQVLQTALTICCESIYNRGGDGASFTDMTLHRLKQQLGYSAIGYEVEQFAEAVELVENAYPKARMDIAPPIAVDLANNALLQKVVAAYRKPQTLRSIWRSGPTWPVKNMPEQADARCEITSDLATRRTRVVTMGFGLDNGMLNGFLATGDGHVLLGGPLIDRKVDLRKPKPMSSSPAAMEMVVAFSSPFTWLQGQIPPAELSFMYGEEGVDYWVFSHYHGSRTSLETVKPEADDPRQRPGLRFTQRSVRNVTQTVTLRIDPESFLIDEEVPEVEERYRGSSSLSRPFKTAWKLYARVLDRPVSNADFNAKALARRPPDNLTRIRLD